MIWHLAELVEPEYDKPILCWTFNGRVVTFQNTGNERHWYFLRRKYAISHWVYQAALKPSNQ